MPLIVGFIPVKESEVTVQEKPDLVELSQLFPSKLDAVLEDDTEISVSVSEWECLGDYGLEQENYQFSPVIEDYRLMKGITVPLIKLVISSRSKLSSELKEKKVLNAGNADLGEDYYEIPQK